MSSFQPEIPLIRLTKTMEKIQNEKKEIIAIFSKMKTILKYAILNCYINKVSYKLRITTFQEFLQKSYRKKLIGK